VLVYLDTSAPTVDGVRTPEHDTLASEMQERIHLLEEELGA
jgi:hypothetical protein